MSYPTRAPELRTITIETTKFRWRFFQKEVGSKLGVYGPDSGRQPLIVLFAGWQDSWTVHSAPSEGEPNISTTIGPKFVSQAIAFGLANGWQPEQIKSPFYVDYQGDKFSLRGTA